MTQSIIVHNLKGITIPVVTGCPFSRDMLLDDNHEAEIVFADGNSVEAQVAELTPKTEGNIKWL